MGRFRPGGNGSFPGGSSVKERIAGFCLRTVRVCQHKNDYIHDPPPFSEDPLPEVAFD